jgi:hypothetical protein
MLAELPLLTFVIRNCFKPIREKHVLELKGEQRMSPNNVRHERARTMFDIRLAKNLSPLRDRLLISLIIILDTNENSPERGVRPLPPATGQNSHSRAKLAHVVPRPPLPFADQRPLDSDRKSMSVCQ